MSDTSAEAQKLFFETLFSDFVNREKAFLREIYDDVDERELEIFRLGLTLGVKRGIRVRDEFVPPNYRASEGVAEEVAE